MGLRARVGHLSPPEEVWGTRFARTSGAAVHGPSAAPGEAACDAGCTTYHMGETGSSASLSQFKTRFGARPVAYQELRIERLPVTAVTTAAHAALDRGRRAVAARRGGGGS